MPTVIATPGASNATSYVTVAEADTYLEARPNVTAWTLASATDRAVAVITATRLLTPLSWLGSRTSRTQALAWPRTACVDPDAPVGYTGYRGDESIYFDPAVVPARIKDATCELALEVLKAGTADLATLDGDAGLVAKTIGPISKAWGTRGKPQGLARFTQVLTLIRPLLGGTGVIRS